MVVGQSICAVFLRGDTAECEQSVSVLHTYRRIGMRVDLKSTMIPGLATGALKKSDLKRVKREVKKLRTILGRVVRKVERKVGQFANPLVKQLAGLHFESERPGFASRRATIAYLTSLLEGNTVSVEASVERRIQKACCQGMVWRREYK